MPADIRRLGDLCTQVRGVTYEKSEASAAPASSLVPILRANNIKNEGGVALDDLVYVPNHRVGPNQYLRSGDIVVATSSGSIDIVGKAAIVPDDFRGSFGAFCKVIRPDKAVIDPLYLSLFMRAPQYRFTISSLAGGANINNLRNEHLSGIRIPLPQLPEQRRIAAMLDKADAIRRKRRESIRLSCNLLRSAFIDIVGPSASGYVGWPVCALEALAAKPKGSMRTGPFGSDLRHSEFVDDGVAVLGIDNAVNNEFKWAERRYITHEKYALLKRFTVFSGDVIVTIMGTTGRAAVVPDDIPTAITTKHLASITLNRDIAEPEFVAQAIHSHPDVLCQIEQANRGAIMNGLNLGLIKSLRLRVPPISIQRRFSNTTACLRRNRQKLMDLSEKADMLFQSLSHRAFAGELS